MPFDERTRRRARSGVLLAALALSACGPDLEVPPATTDPATIARQAQAFAAGMKPRGPGRPVIAVVARNGGTEITDLMVTHAVLQRSGVADVQVVAPRRGRVALYPGFEVEVAQDLAGFDAAHPGGADYVVVPAMDDVAEPAITKWLQQQAQRGARILGVCAGALIVGRAGLLDGRRFVTHWYFRGDAIERHPTARYAPNRRYLVDRDVATTTGVTASVPAMLALVEAIAGRDRAQALAAELGVRAWSPVHDSSRYGLDARLRMHYVLTRLAFWRREELHADVRDGMDDIALALASDAWMRTGYASVVATAPGPVKLASGLVLVARPASADGGRPLPLTAGIAPVRQLDRTLCEIEERFGAVTREQVMMEIEYPGGSDPCARR